MEEGINWTPIDYFNNKIVCDVIENKVRRTWMIFLQYFNWRLVARLFNKLGFWFPILIETSRYNVCVR